jgi:hypothetical protein
MEKFNYKMGTIYQFVVLFAIVSFLGWQFYVTKEFNEILLGALLGVMIGMPFKDEKEQ